MGAAGFVGRVGGLAVALGVGAAVCSGATAWADDGGSSAHAGSARSGSSQTTAGPAKHSAAPKAASGRSRPVSTVRAQSITSVPAATATPTAQSDPSAPQTPPADSPLELAALAYSRRDTGISARTAAAASLAPEALVQAAAAQNTALIMGPSGVPIPKPKYIEEVLKRYIIPSYPDAVPDQLDTPEGLYPITGVKSLPLNVSVEQGLDILRRAISEQVLAGNTVTVFGYSQSSIISSLLMRELDPSAPVQFVLVGNEMNPNGGFLARFPGLKLPSLGLDFYGATPENAFPVTNYTLEYDGFADFPRYPLNFLADLNAGLGIVFVHTKYATIDPTRVENAIELPTTDPSQKYYIIPTENLPLLEPLRLLPVIGKPIADLLQPALKVIVNLGYGDPKYGWSNEGYANVQVPFGFIPDVNWGEVAQLFMAGVAQGITDFVADISPGGVMQSELAALRMPTLAPAALPAPTDVITDVQKAISTLAAVISNAAASAYAALLPTADIVNALTTMLPAYDVNLFLDGVKQSISGDPLTGLINAIGRPIAANVGLITTAGLIEVLVILQAVEGAFGKQTDV